MVLARRGTTFWAAFRHGCRSRRSATNNDICLRVLGAFFAVLIGTLVGALIGSLPSLIMLR